MNSLTTRDINETKSLISELRIMKVVQSTHHQCAYVLRKPERATTYSYILKTWKNNYKGIETTDTCMVIINNKHMYFSYPDWGLMPL